MSTPARALLPYIQDTLKLYVWQHIPAVELGGPKWRDWTYSKPFESGKYDFKGAKM